MKIAYCELLQHGEAFRKSKLRELAVQMNHQLEVVQISSTEESALVFAWSEFQSLVNDADSLFIPHGGVFEWPGMLESIQARIANGTRAILQLDENSLDVQNKFLASYDLTATRIRLRPYQPGPVPYRRENDCLRDFRLFAGVDQVHIQQPNAIWYGGESLPVLVGAQNVVVADGFTDFPADWNSRELASIAAWHSTNGGGILAIAGNVLGDPYTGPTGVYWPGIELNEQFAKNILNYLADGRPANTPEDHCHRIEVNLADFVLKRLKAVGDDWWAKTVPVKIQRKCDARARDELSTLPKECFIDLIDLKVLIQLNWPLFQNDLAAAGCQGGKNSSLRWIDGLNKLRRLIAHPLRRHFSGFEFSPKDRELLRYCHRIALSLSRLKPNERGIDSGAKQLKQNESTD